MFSVFMFGDGIRLCTDHDPGYGSYAVEALLGRAYVYSPAEDAQSTHHTLLNLNRWIEEQRSLDREDVQIVHWNVGLWDAVRVCGGEPVTPAALYADRLEQIHRCLRAAFPNARMVFALTTPVIEREKERPLMWRNEDIRRMNKAAADRLKPLGVEINDLYTAASEFGPECYRSGEMLSAEGARRLGQTVAECILNVAGGHC